jgi:hypothetical protein
VLLIGLLTPQAGPVNFFTLNTFSQFLTVNFDGGKLFLLLNAMSSSSSFWSQSLRVRI